MFGKLSLVSLLALTSISCKSDYQPGDTGIDVTQETHGRISGQVTDTDGSPLIDISVSAQHKTKNAS